MADTLSRLKRALADKPDADRVTLNRSTVEALIAAAEGRPVVTLSDAARLIQRQRYWAVEDALSACEGLQGEDAVTAFLDSMRIIHDENP